jgi:hypothetical protein
MASDVYPDLSRPLSRRGWPVLSVKGRWTRECGVFRHGGVKKACERGGASGYRSAATGEGGCAQVLGARWWNERARRLRTLPFAMTGPRRSPLQSKGGRYQLYGSWRERPMVTSRHGRVCVGSAGRLRGV